MQDAINELAKASGYPIQFQGDATKFADKKITLTGKTTFWQALDRLCDQAELMERVDFAPQALQPDVGKRIMRRPMPMPQQNVPAGPIVLIHRGNDKSSISYAGAVKIEVRLSRNGDAHDLAVNDPVPLPGQQSNSPLTVLNGNASGYFQSTGTANSVNVDDYAFSWQVRSITFVGGFTIPVQLALRQTTFHIYTLYDQPLGTQAYPNPAVLELSANFAKASGGIFAAVMLRDITIGIYNSGWRDFRDSTYFLRPTARMTYITGFYRVAINGDPLANPFTSQTYDLGNFLSFIERQAVFQECSDNSDLETIMAQSLGIPVTTLFLARQNVVYPLPPPGQPQPNVNLNAATYFPAGLAVTRTDNFLFHQFIYVPSPIAWNPFDAGLVYDPSTKNQNGVNYFAGVPLRDYLDTLFPGQRQVGYITRPVDLSVGTVVNSSVFFARPNNLAIRIPAAGADPLTTNIVLTGAGFNQFMNFVAFSNFQRQQDGLLVTPAQNLWIQNVQVQSATQLSFDLVVTSSARAGALGIAVYKGASEAVNANMLLFPNFWAEPFITLN